MTMTRRAKPPPPPGSERRQFPRYDVLAQVEIRGGDSTLVVPVRNISVGGLYVDLESHDLGGLGPALMPGQRATIYLDASEGGDDPGLAVSREAEILRIDRPRERPPGRPDASPSERSDEHISPPRPVGGQAGMALRWTLAEVEVIERLTHILAVLRQRGGLADDEP